MMMVVVGDERGIIYSCPVTHMAGTLALTSPSFAPLKRETPFPILLVGLHADIVEQNYHTRETCRFDDHTSMRLQTSTRASHQN